jgi:hypothetical protein
LRLRTHLYRLTFFLLLGYGFLYFSYKWLIPTEVNSDFVQYYGMIQHPFNFHAAPSPWVYRQWNALLVHVLWKVRLYYPDAVHFRDPRYDQHVFFASLLTNFLSVVVAAWLTTLVIDHWLRRSSVVLPLLAGMLCFFSFYLQETTLTGQADGLTWAFIALCYLLYQKRSLVPFCIVVLFSILQREILPLIFLVVAITQLLVNRYHGRQGFDARKEERFLSVAALWSLISFGAYMGLRFVIHAPGIEHQSDPRAILHYLLTFRLTRPYVFQVFIGQNLLALLLLLSLLVYKRMRTFSPMLLPILAACLALLAISIMAYIGSNASRMLAMLTPIVASEIAIALIQLERIPPQLP